MAKKIRVTPDDAVDDFLDWTEQKLGEKFDEKKFVNQEDAEKRVAEIIDAARAIGKEHHKRNLQKFKEAIINRATPATSRWRERLDTFIEENVETEAESFKQRTKTADLNRLDEVRYNQSLPTTVKEELETARKEVGLDKIRRSLARIENEKSLRKLETTVKLQGIELDSETKGALERRRSQLIDEPKRIISDIRRGILEAQTPEQLEGVAGLFESNRELISQQERSSIIIRDIETRLELKQEDFESD